MAEKKQQPKLEPRKLKDLLPYPRQADFFDDIPEEDLKALARALREGAVPPLQILPDNRAGLPANTINDGHMRAKAHELNGDIEVPVLVRYDLAVAPLEQFEREFLAANQHRRHLDTLAKARAALRLYELSRKHPERKLCGSEVEDARDAVGRAIGMSGRNLQRSWNVLRTPSAVQEAFRRGELSLVDAAPIGCMPVEVQKEIATRIEGGESPKKILGEQVRQAQPDKQAEKAVLHLCRALGDYERQLAGWITEADEAVFQERPGHVRRGRTLIAALINFLKQAKAAAVDLLNAIRAASATGNDDLMAEEE